MKAPAHELLSKHHAIPPEGSHNSARACCAIKPPWAASETIAQLTPREVRLLTWKSTTSRSSQLSHATAPHGGETKQSIAFTFCHRWFVQDFKEVRSERENCLSSINKKSCATVDSSFPDLSTRDPHCWPSQHQTDCRGHDLPNPREDCSIAHDSHQLTRARQTRHMAVTTRHPSNEGAEWHHIGIGCFGLSPHQHGLACRHFLVSERGDTRHHIKAEATSTALNSKLCTSRTDSITQVCCDILVAMKAQTFLHSVGAGRDL